MVPVLYEAALDRKEVSCLPKGIDFIGACRLFAANPFRSPYGVEQQDTVHASGMGKTTLQSQHYASMDA